MGSDVTEKPQATLTRKPRKYSSQKNIPRSKKTQDSPKGYFPGVSLMNQLFKRMNEIGINTRELAENHLEIAYSYLMLLAKGERLPSGLDTTKLRNCAKFLSIPYTQVLLLAEVLTKEDFFLDIDMEDRVERVYQLYCADPLLGGFAPKRDEWQSLSLSIKLSIAILYENSKTARYLDVENLESSDD